jgi:regulator of PEP synthase PpsR (kinase-PPPase family)
MEITQDILNSSILEDIVKLPESMKNKPVKIVVTPIEDVDFEKALEGSISQSLVGVLHASNITLEEIRAERLKKYEGLS